MGIVSTLSNVCKVGSCGHGLYMVKCVQGRVMWAWLVHCHMNAR